LQRFCPSFISVAWIMFISLVSSIFELKVLNLLHFIMSSLFYILVWPISIVLGILLIASVFFPCIGLLFHFLFKLFSYPCTLPFSIWGSIHFHFLFMFFHSIVIFLFWFYSTFFLLSFMMRWLIFVLLTHFIQVFLQFC
jgi:hypothetical protein